MTLQPLDSDTLAGLELREGMAGAEAVTESSTPEQLAALEGEAERLSPEESEVEKLAALTPAPTEALHVEALLRSLPIRSHPRPNHQRQTPQHSP